MILKKCQIARVSVWYTTSFREPHMGGHKKAYLELNLLIPADGEAHKYVDAMLAQRYAYCKDRIPADFPEAHYGIIDIKCSPLDGALIDIPY